MPKKYFLEGKMRCFSAKKLSFLVFFWSLPLTGVPERYLPLIMIRAIIETLSCIRSKHKKTDYLLTLFKMSLCFFCSIADETFRGDFKTYDDNLLCTFENSEFYCGNYFASSFWPSSQLQIIQLTAVRKVAVSLNTYRQIIEGILQF